MAPNKPKPNVQSNSEDAFSNLDKAVDTNVQEEKKIGQKLN